MEENTVRNNRAQIFPDSAPPFTLKQLKESIDRVCFEPSNTKSFFYLFRSFSMALFMWLVVAPWLHQVQANTMTIWALWLGFALVQGTVLMGLWVLAHECGHGGFSKNDRVNQVVGMILHTFLLVPFYSWRISHGIHHNFTNHLGKDQVFVPFTEDEVGSRKKLFLLLEKFPILNSVFLVVMLFTGWLAYLVINVTGPSSQAFSSHFMPSSAIFKKHQHRLVVISNIALLIMLAALSLFAYYFGIELLLKLYLFPYLVVNAWLVFITFLQHTDRNIPYYDSSEWSFVRGALASVDRKYGLFDFFLHRIGSKHVIHHLFPKIPHYYAAQATAAIKPLLGEYYTSDSTNIFKAFWLEFCECKFVRGKGTYWFQKSLPTDVKQDV